MEVARGIVCGLGMRAQPCVGEGSETRMRHYVQSSIMSVVVPPYQTSTDPARHLGKAELLMRTNIPADLWHNSCVQTSRFAAHVSNARCLPERIHVPVCEARTR